VHFLEIEMKVLTYEYIHQHKTPNGGWTKRQLEAIGLDWPPQNGWIGGVCGKAISDQSAVDFENGKHEFSSNPNKRRP
jgi:hypothetical protein